LTYSNKWAESTAQTAFRIIPLSLPVDIEFQKEKHRGLSSQIEDLEKDLAFDQALVSRLKRQRLKLKDKINRSDLE
jgi:hypothetical protein